MGDERVWVVDPATTLEEERQLALQVISDEMGRGRRVMGILLTHHHRDHVCAAAWLSDALGLPIWAHVITEELLAGVLQVDHSLSEGDVLEGGGPEHRWEVLHTPGHASGHIVLWQEARGWMVGGDMVAAVGTIIVEPPDGHMATYMEQLERLAELRPKALIPAHGEVIREPVAHLRGYIEHRKARENRVVQALRAAGGPRTLMEVTVDSYPDVPPAIHPLATRSCLAHLVKLEEEALAIQLPDDRWEARRPASS